MDDARPTSTPARRAPRLLLLVFGIFLVLVGLTASALVAITSVHLSSTTLTAVADRDRSLVDLFANGTLRASDLTEGRLPAARQAELEDRLEALARSDGVAVVQLRNAAGDVVVATNGSAGVHASEADLEAALAGEPFAALVDDGSVLEELLPVATAGGDVLGLVVFQRDAAALLAGLDAARRDVLIVTLIAALVLAAILVVVFRAAHVRIARQHAQLVEASRRDALTGMLNHGTVVALLVGWLEEARASGDPIGVALVDVDNFRLFNDTHGHVAGDSVLLRVAELVADAARGDGVAARYGPDELVLLKRGRTAEEVAESLGELQATMRSLGVQFGESETLPVSVSIGVVGYPQHATSVTPLLSEASVALAEAKASGGDAIVVGRTQEEGATVTGSFDVLHGLVLAVDTKDRYTKRHSEDVARYAVFLARRLGHDDIVETVRLAGLLHDVGKIGIPDTLLRKPSRLTDAEFRIFNQHVALGDAIVRDLPELDEVRAGVRHHHERWDGTGYLAGLKGEEIPLVARLIAVADAFSAMTTTRPYRKALDVAEALRRLRDAAGTQLQLELVDAFVTGIETDPNAPVPNDNADAWQPLRVA